MRHYFRLFIFSIIPVLFFSCTEKKEVSEQKVYEFTFQNPALPVETRINDLLTRMTLDEKISQLTNTSPAVERLGIPAYEWWNEALHGVARAGNATVFPQAIGLAATWDTELIHEIADVISTEARAKHHEAFRNGDYGRYKGLTFWSPNINIFRDPRWGRGQETYGEDPFLTSRIGVAFVKGLQGDDPEYMKAAACAKHYAVHSGPEHLRHEFDITVSDRDLWETYLPAFKTLVIEANVEAVMCAYNRYDGDACCGSDTLLHDILRNQWGFEGHIVSDCGAIEDIFMNHKIVKTAPEAAAIAIKSGTDVRCGWGEPALKEAVTQGLVSEEEINTALRRLLNTRFKLGMFDPPEMVSYAQIPYDKNTAPEHGRLALETARQSIVLLKNANSILPLSKEIKKVAVIGPNADDYEVLLGNYNGTPVEYSTVLTGVKKVLPVSATVTYTLGVNYLGEKYRLKPVPAEAFSVNGEKGIKTSYYSNVELKDEPFKVATEQDINREYSYGAPLEGMPVDNFSIRFEGEFRPDKTGKYYLGITGDDGYRLYLEDKPVIDSWLSRGKKTTVCEVELTAGKLYPFKIEYYDGSNNAQLMFGWHEPGYDLFEEAIKIATDADAIIFAGGITPRLEGEEMGEDIKFEGFYRGDRTKISLPTAQTEMMKALMKLGKPVVFVNMSGSAVSFVWENENVPAIIQAWYPGEAGGEAIADIIFGNYNPSGRLPVTFYRSEEQLPPYEDYAMAGRTYRYFDGDVLYPFGHGLSYSTFEYSNIRLEPGEINKDKDVTISVDLKNTSERDGAEVVQVYITDNSASFPVPYKSLRAFKRVGLKAGEKRNITFSLRPDDFALYDDNMQRIIEPGDFTVMVGGNSASGIKATVSAKENIVVKEQK
ncbi:MAG: glycoside hydrolase family 3 C-terminal domain-containing protein [Deltaproteobacteria bacterium]|nr:glycoside hydrolase family 3 C-terminal domain-containing protein [Deltaproteobacteria bacterium]